MNVVRKFVVHEKLIPDAAGMVTIGRDHHIWTDDLPRFEGEEAEMQLAGTKFARIQPPETVSDEGIAELCALFKRCGVQVILQPRPKSQTITKQQHIKRARVSTRQVVETLVAEANSPDRDALSKIVQEQLSKVGL